MIRCLPALLLLLAVASSPAQVPASSPAPEDLHTLRQLMEQQSRQLDTLMQEVARLIQIVDNNRTAAPAVATQAAPPAPESSATPATVEPPKVEPVPTEGGVPHVIAKGETLTSIAKHNKVSVAELLKVNKIEDARKLQIGQTIIIPSPKPAESPKQNKM